MYVKSAARVLHSKLTLQGNYPTADQLRYCIKQEIFAGAKLERKYCQRLQKKSSITAPSYFRDKRMCKVQGGNNNCAVKTFTVIIFAVDCLRKPRKFAPCENFPLYGIHIHVRIYMHMYNNCYKLHQEYACGMDNYYSSCFQSHHTLRHH